MSWSEGQSELEGARAELERVGGSRRASGSESKGTGAEGELERPPPPYKSP